MVESADFKASLSVILGPLITRNKWKICYYSEYGRPGGRAESQQSVLTKRTSAACWAAMPHQILRAGAAPSDLLGTQHLAFDQIYYHIRDCARGWDRCDGTSRAVRHPSVKFVFFVGEKRGEIPRRDIISVRYADARATRDFSFVTCNKQLRQAIFRVAHADCD